MEEKAQPSLDCAAHRPIDQHRGRDRNAVRAWRTQRYRLRSRLSLSAQARVRSEAKQHRHIPTPCSLSWSAHRRNSSNPRRATRPSVVLGRSIDLSVWRRCDSATMSRQPGRRTSMKTPMRSTRWTAALRPRDCPTWRGCRTGKTQSPAKQASARPEGRIYTKSPRLAHERSIARVARNRRQQPQFDRHPSRDALQKRLRQPESPHPKTPRNLLIQ